MNKKIKKGRVVQKALSIAERDVDGERRFLTATFWRIRMPSKQNPFSFALCFELYPSR